MNISGNKPADSQGVYINSQQIDKEKAIQDKNRLSNGKGTDSVNLSKRLKEVDNLKIRINQLPESRDAKIEEMRNAITSGSYQVDARNVAGKMLEELF